MQRLPVSSAGGVIRTRADRNLHVAPDRTSWRSVITGNHRVDRQPHAAVSPSPTPADPALS
jgi:hypothetical protein